MLKKKGIDRDPRYDSGAQDCNRTSWILEDRR